MAPGQPCVDLRGLPSVASSEVGRSGTGKIAKVEHEPLRELRVGSVRQQGDAVLIPELMPFRFHRRERALARAALRFD
ncbi:hypothetical protein PR202_gb29929 [Eleusine coracana subsp. coracana]|uniref:Uncharacterized protein n=1 Tax=Eleusine coracana subsp. coracana TaxID=191504 RepID=A0AAV5G1B8_ELECO|nr:hypothetical protein PR202_gb29929 [Eleusine coracana subsp. coracana]